MQRRPLGLGIVGCGTIGAQHAAHAAGMSDVQLVGLHDLDRGRAREVSQRHGGVTVYDGFEDLLAQPALEALVLAVHPNVRLPLAERALRRGLHLLLEKPVAMNAVQVRQLQQWQGDCIVACCSARFRCLPGAAAIQSVLESGALGQLRAIHWRVMREAPTKPDIRPPAWRLQKAVNGGGILMNWGCYDLDYLLGIGGPLEVRRVWARMWGLGPAYRAFVPADSHAETHVQALMECAGGVSITYERAEYVAGPSSSLMVMTGDAGSLDFQMVPQADVQDRLTVSDPQRGIRTETIQRHPSPVPNPHRAVLADFCQAVRNRREPRTNLTHALRVQATTDALYAAADSGQWVEVPATP